MSNFDNILACVHSPIAKPAYNVLLLLSVIANNVTLMDALVGVLLANVADLCTVDRPLKNRCFRLLNTMAEMSPDSIESLPF
jgi:hypothetical protein